VEDKDFVRLLNNVKFIRGSKEDSGCYNCISLSLRFNSVHIKQSVDFGNSVCVCMEAMFVHSYGVGVTHGHGDHIYIYTHSVCNTFGVSLFSPSFD
jgi:hypothetical protein